MGVSAAGKELFGQRDQGEACARSLARLGIDGTCPRRNYARAPEWLLQADCGRAGEDELMASFALAPKCLVGGILCQNPAEVGLRAEKVSGHKAVESEVVAFRALERVVTLVADKGEAGTPDSSWKRKQLNFTSVDAFREVAGSYSAELQSIGH